MGCLVYVRSPEFQVWWHDLDVYALREPHHLISTEPRVSETTICEVMQQSIRGLYMSFGA